MRRTLNRNHYFILGFLLGLILSFYIPEDVWELAQDAASNCPGIVEDERFGEGFEPHLNLINKPLAAKKRAKTVIRPRYYSSELGIREKLFIGVMTSQENINTYATAINKTTAHLVNKIKFFINADNVKSNFKLKNIVGFTDTRENLRPFHILKYIADNYLEDYDYFLIIPDTVYVDAKKLKNLLYHLSISFDIYMGRKKSEKQLNQFNDNIDDIDINNNVNNIYNNNGGSENNNNNNNNNNNIDGDHNYCDLNAGILLSSSVIRKMRTNLDWCVRNAVTNIHSINIGRCVKYSSKVTGCQDKFQEIEIKSYEFDNIKLYKDLKVLQKDSEFRNSTIIYPVTSVDEFYILHAYFCRLHLDALREKSYQLEKKSYFIANGTIPNDILEIRWPLGTIPVSMPETRHDIITWHFINRTHTFMPNHENAIEPLKQIDLQDLNKIINITVSYIKKKYHQNEMQWEQQQQQQQQSQEMEFSEIGNLNSLKYEKIHTIYRRFDPMRGMDYHIHFLFLDLRTNKRHIKSFYVVKPLGKVEIIPSPYVTESTRIAILLPTFEHQIDNLDNFIKLYEKICMENQDNTFLMLIFLYNYNSSSKGDLDPFRNIKQLALDLTTKYKTDGSRIAWVSIRLPQQLNEISSNIDNNIMLSSIYGKYEILSLAVTDLSLPKIGLDSLILLGSNAMTFKADFLNRVRMNTIQGFQIFSPIAFMMYPCKAFNFCKECDTCDVSQGTGYFDKYNYDVTSFYSKDYVEARKKIENFVPIIRTDNDIELLFNRNDKSTSSSTIITTTTTTSTTPIINNVLDIFIHSQLSIHTLRGIEPNLRYGNTIRNFIKKRNSIKNLPKCPYSKYYNSNSNYNNNENENEINNIPNSNSNINKNSKLLNNYYNENKCIHLAARKHIGDAIIRYEDKIGKGRH
ncbi:chondroitin sulfate glucuronyltransferase [Condylostylus longicornis]|uniref:chondroitin sulfate glucuronyltransferase n=1 Tax=Condylostylus longicornis TaxID=2530218 RepID=UPI00244E3566|nr:chondroitin sulfate glucuronyltransferase [Condylostylus longicornis]